MKSFNFSGIAPFEFSISYNELKRKNHFFQIDTHTHHSECEIYINLSGNISFMVEDKIYPVHYGDAIITRPYEYHHCIYENDALHKHFWILFSANQNEHLLKPFFDRKKGEGNLISLKPEKKEQLIELCRTLYEKKLTEAEKYTCFFKIIELFSNKSYDIEKESIKNNLPDDIKFAIDYINKNIENQINIREIAELANVSLNSLERHFKESIFMSPSQFIAEKKLNLAATLLLKGESVSIAAMKSGFCDSSHFIYKFKKHFGTTPLKYKKKNNFKEDL